MHATAVSEWSALSLDFNINSGNDFMHATAVSEWSALSSDFIINGGNEFRKVSALSLLFSTSL